MTRPITSFRLLIGALLFMLGGATVTAVAPGCDDDDDDHDVSHSVATNDAGTICSATFDENVFSLPVGGSDELDILLRSNVPAANTDETTTATWTIGAGGHFATGSTSITLTVDPTQAGFLNGIARNTIYADGPPGVYPVTITFTGPNGCVATVNGTLVVVAPSADAAADGPIRNVPDGGSDAGDAGADASEGGADSGAAPSATFTLMSTGGLFPPQTFTVLTCGQGYAYLDVPAAVRTALNLPDDSYLGFFQTAPGVIDVYIKSGNTLYYDGHSDATYNSGTVPITSLTKSANGGATVTDTLTFYGTYTPCP